MDRGKVGTGKKWEGQKGTAQKKRQGQKGTREKEDWVKRGQGKRTRSKGDRVKLKRGQEKEDRGKEDREKRGRGNIGNDCVCCFCSKENQTSCASVLVLKVFRRTIKKERKKKTLGSPQDCAGRAALERRVEDEDLQARNDPDDYDDYDDDYDGRMRRDDENAAGCYFQELDSPEREEHPIKWRENAAPSDGGLPLVRSDNLVANQVVMKRPLCRLAQLPSSQPDRQTYQKLSQCGHEPSCQQRALGVSTVAAAAAECSDNNAGSDASDSWQRQSPGVSAVASGCGEVHGGNATADVWQKRPLGVSVTAAAADSEYSLVNAGSESVDIWQIRPPGVSATVAAAECSLVNAGSESTDIWQKRPPGVSAVAATDHIDTGSTVFPAFRRGQKIQVR